MGSLSVVLWNHRQPYSSIPFINLPRFSILKVVWPFCKIQRDLKGQSISRAQALESLILYAVWLCYSVVNAAGNFAIGNSKIRALGEPSPTFKKLCIIPPFSQTYNNRGFFPTDACIFSTPWKDLQNMGSFCSLSPIVKICYLTMGPRKKKTKKQQGKIASGT